MTNSALQTWLDRDGSLLRLRLARPKANLIDATMIAALGQALSQHAALPGLAAVLLDAEGPHFSFGASIEEHLPEHCAGMLRDFHALVVQMLDFPVPILAAVQGQCLGGGLEVVCSSSRIFAANDVQFGQPEIKLGVFAPVASCLLPQRIGQTNAEDLLFSGRSLSAEEALQLGLVQHIDADPEQAALHWFDQHLAGLSASSIRFAVKAARGQNTARFKEKIATVEKLYIKELMQSHDALEGLTAFMEKRSPRWSNN